MKKFYADVICKDPGDWFMKGHTYTFVVKVYRWSGQISVTRVQGYVMVEIGDEYFLSGLEEFVKTFDVTRIHNSETNFVEDVKNSLGKERYL